MKYLLPVFVLLNAVISISVCAEEELKHPVKPLLWKIEGGDLKKPSYLFGTIHLGGGALDKLHPSAEKAFEEADVVFTEIPMDAKTQLTMAESVMRKDGKKLSDSLGPELTTNLDNQLRAINPALDSTPFEPMRTWIVAVMLPLLEAQMMGTTSIDKMVWDRAVKDEKKTGGIETAEFQMDVFNTFTEEEQVILMSETLRIMSEDRAAEKNSIKELKAAYIQGDAELIKKLMGESIEQMRKGPHKETGEKFYDKILTARDATMAATIAELLKNSPDTVHFFAAGVAHFTGEVSICSHLEKAGYRITRIDQ